MIVGMSNWKKVENFIYHGKSCAEVWESIHSPIRVLKSKSTTSDGRHWIHVSMSRPSRCPTHEELSEVKDLFIGTDIEAYQVFAKKEEHVNVHQYCLHLWAPVDGKRCVANLQDLVNEEVCSDWEY